MEKSLKRYALGLALLASTLEGGGTHLGESGAKGKPKKDKRILTPKQKQQRIKNKLSRKSRKMQFSK